VFLVDAGALVRPPGGGWTSSSLRAAGSPCGLVQGVHELFKVGVNVGAGGASRGRSDACEFKFQQVRESREVLVGHLEGLCAWGGLASIWDVSDLGEVVGAGV
jgi:hypothetical protein